MPKSPFKTTFSPCAIESLQNKIIQACIHALMAWSEFRKQEVRQLVEN